MSKLSKSSAPAAPDYTPLANASTDAAMIAAQTSKDQLDWAKQQWGDLEPTTKKYLDSMTANSDAQTANAATDRARYEGIYQPVEDQFVKTATGWNSADRANQQAGAAEAEVATQFDAQRKTALNNLESYGIDPSQTRYGALDLGTRVAQAAATAAAGTGSRLQTEATGLALQGEAINIGKGYPSQVAQSYAGATAAGTAGINSQINTTASGANTMGTPTQWGALQTGNINAGVGALNTGFQNQLAHSQFNNNVGSSQVNEIGQLIGGIASVAMM